MPTWFKRLLCTAALLSSAISSSQASMNDLHCLTQEFSGPDQNRAEYINATSDAARVFRIPPAILVGIKLVESGRGLNPYVTNNNNNGTTDRGYYQVNTEVWLPELRRIGLPIDQDQLHHVRNNALIAAWIYTRQLERVNNRLEAVGYYHKGGVTGAGSERIRSVYKEKFMEKIRYLTQLCGDVTQQLAAR